MASFTGTNRIASLVPPSPVAQPTVMAAWVMCPAAAPMQAGGSTGAGGWASIYERAYALAVEQVRADWRRRLEPSLN